MPNDEPAIKRLEIIHLRLAGRCSDPLVEKIQNSAWMAEPGTHLRIYRRAGVADDLGIHLNYAGEPHSDRPCNIGEQLAAELRRHGMVDHSIWYELIQHPNQRR